MSRAPDDDLASSDTLAATSEGSGVATARDGGGAPSSSLATYAPESAVPSVADALDVLPVVEPSTYALGDEVGRGGLGRILRARDPIFGRTIAVKELLSGHPDARVRFLREATITARLQHPAIVPVYVAGRWPDGAPFYAMKLVAGRSLAEALKARPSLDARVGLLPSMIAVCEAIAYAHSQRVIHRDLKPHNVLLGDFGEALVIDWGLAKDLAAGDGDDAGDAPAGDPADPSATVAGAILGTPAYMPPEQAIGEAVDERADVYALGAMLYELLAGELAYPGARSTEDLLARLLAAPPVPLARRAPAAPRDLVAIVDKAMARRPADRYRDAGELASDLRRFQTGQLVSVRQYTSRELIARWVRRHRAPVAVGAIAVAALAVVAVISVRRILAEERRTQAAAALAEQRRAEAERERAEAVAHGDEAVLAQAASLAASDPTAAIAWLARMSADSPRWSAARTIAADAAHHGIADLLAAPDFTATDLLIDDAGQTLVAYSYLIDRVVAYDLRAGTSRAIDVGDRAMLGALSADGRLLAMGGDHAVTIHDLGGGAPRVLADGAGAYPLAFSPDGTRLAAATDRGSTLWSVAGGAPRVLPGGRGTVRFTEDGGSLVALEADAHQARVHDLVAGTTRELAVPEALEGLVLSADGAWIAGRDRDEARSGVQVLDVATGIWRELPDSRHGYHALEMTSGGLITTGPTEIARWDLRRGTVERAPRTSASPSTQVEGGGPVVVWATDEELTIRGLDDGRTLRRGQPGKVEAMALSRDGRTLVVAGGDGTLRRWRLAPTGEQPVCGDAMLPFVAGSPDGRWLVQRGDVDGTLEVCEPATGAIRVLRGATAPVEDFVFAPGGQRVVTAGAAPRDAIGEVTIWDLGAGTGRPVAAAVAPRAISDDGARLVGLVGRDVAVVEVATGAVDVRCPDLGAATVSADGRTAVVVSAAGLVACELATGERRTLPGFEHPFDLAISPDGGVVAVFGAQGGALWNLAAGTRTDLDLGTAEWARHLAFSRDGQRLAVVAPTVGTVFDRHGAPVHRLRLPAGYLEQVAFSPDGTRLLVTDHDNQATIHDLATGQRRSLRGHLAAVRGWFLADGRSLISIGGADRPTIWRWRDDLPLDPAALRRWIAAATTARIGPDGRLVGGLVGGQVPGSQP